MQQESKSMVGLVQQLQHLIVMPGRYRVKVIASVASAQRDPWHTIIYMMVGNYQKSHENTN